LPPGCFAVLDRQARTVEVHHAGIDDRGEQCSPDWLEQIRAPLHLIGERGHRDVEAEPTKAIALAVQRQPVEVLLDQDRRDEPEPELAVGHHGLARRRAHRLALAGELFAEVAAHDHLGRQQLDHLGDVRLDALALAAAPRAGALVGGHRDRIGDPPQVRRRSRRPRLPRGRWCAQLADVVVLSLIDPGCSSQLVVGSYDYGVTVSRLALGRRRLWAALERIEEQHELRRRHLLARLEPSRQARDPPLEVGVTRDQLPTIDSTASRSWKSPSSVRSTSSTGPRSSDSAVAAGSGSSGEEVSMTTRCHHDRDAIRCKRCDARARSM